MKPRGRCPFALAVLEEAVEVCEVRARIQRDQEELAFPVVGVAKLDRLLSGLGVDLVG